ncbi:(2Fe-2S)-binding protein [Pseudoduganella sp. FT25W]|jgi:predicted molibdopterin-dependent oxidoreductase YjgC|uniref:(2Fe-2S)-binding protein n=1 Tax=Duganella alba TaxID=2666081 RepID=A0A6L5QJS1_9BURK|nr:(2Fe-2S)-binding protein [Duganella alba]MRX09989.1 (2Fe-2S)-binding protein [Duganella alba]MRX17816.1 (2Fe-2S)-binding protein [Duganella alba]
MSDTLITLNINATDISVAPGVTVAAAIAMTGDIITRRSVSGAARAPLCGMGVCQECRVTIDGRPHQLSCQTLCADGMHVVTGAVA